MCQNQEFDSRLRTIENKLDQLLAHVSNNLEFRGQNEFNEIIKFLTSPSEYRSALKFLTNWAKKAKKLTIADPYLLSFDKTKNNPTLSNYVDALTSTLPRNIKLLEVFHLPSPNRKIANSVKEYCYENGIRFENYSTTVIHDRVWIKDDTEAIIIGTSFGGIGNKLAFVLPLPPSDLNEFKQELQQIRTKK